MDGTTKSVSSGVREFSQTTTAGLDQETHQDALDHGKTEENLKEATIESAGAANDKEQSDVHNEKKDEQDIPDKANDQGESKDPVGKDQPEAKATESDLRKISSIKDLYARFLICVLCNAAIPPGNTTFACVKSHFCCGNCVPRVGGKQKILCIMCPFERSSPLVRLRAVENVGKELNKEGQTFAQLHDKIKTLLSCPVCLELPPAAGSAPILCPNGHSTCRACKVKLVEKRACPVCRERDWCALDDVTVAILDFYSLWAYYGGGDVPKDYFSQYLIGLLTSFVKGPKCEAKETKR